MGTSILPPNPVVASDGPGADFLGRSDHRERRVLKLGSSPTSLVQILIHGGCVVFKSRHSRESGNPGYRMAIFSKAFSTEKRKAGWRRPVWGQGTRNVPSTKHKVTKGIVKNPAIRALRIYLIIFCCRGVTRGSDPQWFFRSFRSSERGCVRIITPTLFADAVPGLPGAPVPRPRLSR